MLHFDFLSSENFLDDTVTNTSQHTTSVPSPDHLTSVINISITGSYSDLVSYIRVVNPDMNDFLPDAYLNNGCFYSDVITTLNISVQTPYGQICYRFSSADGGHAIGLTGCIHSWEAKLY